MDIPILERCSRHGLGPSSTQLQPKFTVFTSYDHISPDRCSLLTVFSVQTNPVFDPDIREADTLYRAELSNAQAKHVVIQNTP